MQSSLEVLEGLKRKITVEIAAEEIEKEVENKIKSLKNRVKMDGFRRGKVPLSVIRRQYGNSVRIEVLNAMIEKSYSEALEKENLNPVATSDIQPISGFEAGESLKYEALFEVAPEVKVDVENLQITYPSGDVSEEDIDEMIETLRHQQGRWHETDQPAADDARVSIDFSGELDGEAFEGGDGKNVTFQIGKQQMLADFEDGIKGMRTGEEKQFDVRFPDNYNATHLSGKTAQFNVKLNKVEEEELPEVDDAFIALFGISEGGMEAFRKAVRENMERELERALRQIKREKVFDAVLERNAEQEIAEGSVVREIERMAQEMNLEKNITDKNKREEFKKNMLDAPARRRVRLSLLLGKLFEEYEIELDKNLVDERLKTIASTYEEPDEVIAWYRKDRNARTSLESSVLEEQLVNRLFEQADVEQEEKTFKEIMAINEQAYMP